MLHVTPDSPFSIMALLFCGVLVCVFEVVNGFHDTANAVATVIYTRSLRAGQAVLLSSLMNFLGVLAGGLSVAYAMVELLPADVLSPPDGMPAVVMLLSLFGSALTWNLLTWWAGIPNSSSHCMIGAIVGVAVGDSLVHTRSLSEGVDWHQVFKVLEALAVSPLMGMMGAWLFYLALRAMVKDAALYQPPKGEAPPRGWVRWLLVASCSGVSFSHGNNDGQKSIGLIMLTVVGLLPALYALNPQEAHRLPLPVAEAAQIETLLARYDHDGLRPEALAAAARLKAEALVAAAQGGAQNEPVVGTRPLMALRADVFEILAGLKQVDYNASTPAVDRASAKTLRKRVQPVVEFAPWWVRLLSALCLSFGTMIGYQRVVRTLGEKIGRTHLTPAQGASAELVGAGLILTAGYTGLPVSTTHIITAGIAGSMMGAGSGVQGSMVARIMLAWVATLPVTILMAAGLFYVLSP